MRACVRKEPGDLRKQSFCYNRAYPVMLFSERPSVDVYRRRLVRFELLPSMCIHRVAFDWLLVDLSSCMQGLSEVVGSVYIGL